MSVRVIDHVVGVAASLLLVALLATVTAGVVSRAAGEPFSWTEEVSGFLMVWVVSFGWIIATRRNSHIRIRYFQDKLSPTKWKWTEVTIQVSMAVLGACVTFGSLHLIRTNSDVEAVSIPISTAWMYVPLLPAGIATLLQALMEVRRQLTGTPADPARHIPAKEQVQQS